MMIGTFNKRALESITKGKKLILILFFYILSGVCVAQDASDFKSFKTLTEFFEYYKQDGKYLNNVKHTNKGQGLKDGTWIETDDRMKLWVYSYNNGVKDGLFMCYNLNNGQIEKEGKYVLGKLSGSVIIYDYNGNVFSEYYNIRWKINDKKLSKMPATFDQKTFKTKNIGSTKSVIKFHYEADYRLYTLEGEVYKSGTGVFNDDKGYFELDGVWYACDSKLYRIYPL